MLRSKCSRPKLQTQALRQFLNVLIVLIGVAVCASAATTELPDAANGVAYSFQLHFMAMTPISHATIAHPFLLDQAPAGTSPTDPNAVVISTPQADRDYYRVGVGIDLVDLIKQGRRKQQASATTPSQ
jgi:hypothetical protein